LSATVVDAQDTTVRGTAEASGYTAAAVEALAKALRPKLAEKAGPAPRADPLHEAHMHQLKGLGYYYAGQLDEALMEFCLSTQAAPKEKDGLRWLWKTYLAQGEKEHAAVAAKSYRKRFGEDPN
jgi:hypothetical protein